MTKPPYDLQPGAVFAIGGIEHVVERTDRGGRVTLRALRNHAEPEATGTDDGHRPDTDAAARLISARRVLAPLAPTPQDGRIGI